MMRFVLVLLVGCATSYQSARPLPQGKSQVTIGVSRTETIDEGEDSIWVGDLMIRTGVSPRSDAGLRLTRNPGLGENISILTLDGKFALTAPDAKTTLSIGVPVGIIWSENGLDDLDTGAILVTPTIFVGVQMGAQAELVFAPKIFVIVPEGDGDTETEFGGSLGFRFTDETNSWAIHPEVGFMHVSEGDGETFMMFGVAVAAGD